MAPLRARAAALRDLLRSSPSAELDSISALLESTFASDDFPRALAELLTEAFGANRALIVTRLPGLGRQIACTAMGRRGRAQAQRDRAREDCEARRLLARGRCVRGRASPAELEDGRCTPHPFDRRSRDPGRRARRRRHLPGRPPSRGPLRHGSRAEPPASRSDDRTADRRARAARRSRARLVGAGERPRHRPPRSDERAADPQHDRPRQGDGRMQRVAHGTRPGSARPTSRSSCRARCSG